MSTFVDVDTNGTGKDSIDKTKLRRRLEEDIRKEMTTKEMIELAQKRGVVIPYYPKTPLDYHDEPGRPYFGPNQVRHASDLEIGKEYTIVFANSGKSTRRFKGFEYDKEKNKWYFVLYLKEGDGKVLFSLEDVSLHPYRAYRDAPSMHPIRDAYGNLLWRDNCWLEFAPPTIDCSCSKNSRDIQN